MATYGSGAKIGREVIAVARRPTLQVHHRALAVCFVVAAGAATPGAAEWRVGSTTRPSAASAAWGCALPSSGLLVRFYIGETEVTQELWQAVMGSNPSKYKGVQLPVEKVSWDDCQEFVLKLNQQTGMKFSLPTEAQWEFAARGGNKSRGYQYSGSNNLGDVAWFADNSGSSTHDVKTKQANELGIYDMSGNVWEWCQDWKDSYSSSAQTDPTGPSSGSYRVFRGGSSGGSVRYCRVAYRDCYTPDNRSVSLGLRLALQ